MTHYLAVFISFQSASHEVTNVIDPTALMLTGSIPAPGFCFPPTTKFLFFGACPQRRSAPARGVLRHLPL